MTIVPKLDDLVQSVTLYSNVNILFHGYILPFIIVYSGWIYVWCGVYSYTEFYEGGFLGLATIGCVQILCCLFCHWSVHIRCMLTCKREKDIWKATVVKVIPTANNGFAELLKLHRTQVDECGFSIEVLIGLLPHSITLYCNVLEAISASVFMLSIESQVYFESLKTEAEMASETLQYNVIECGNSPINNSTIYFFTLLLILLFLWQNRLIIVLVCLSYINKFYAR